MTKSERIRDLVKLGMTNAEIAHYVGCQQSYVRAVRQRIAGGGLSAADRKYFAKPETLIKRRHYQAERYWSDPAFRQANLQASLNYRARKQSAA